MNILGELEKLRRPHLEIDDCWYSCLKSEDCCNDDSRRGQVCTCGADAHNAILDGVIKELNG